MLVGKNILFIGVRFYHYHEEIIDKLENSYGSHVTFCAERDTSIVYGLVNRIFPSKIELYQEFYYRRILKKILEKKFDYFLVIRGFKMPLWFVRKIKEINPNIKTIYYQWDSNTNSQFIGLDEKYDIIDEFDAKFSFDYRDVQEYPVLSYCPTFYTDEVAALQNIDETILTYDLFYFGSYLPERYLGLVNFINYANEKGYVIKTYFYMTLRYYLIERLKGTKLDRTLIKTRPMSRKTYLKLLEQSRCIVDVSNEKQTGLAMRVIDSFGANKKLLTTNKWILKDMCYNSSQAIVIDVNNLEIPDKFLFDPIKAKFDYDFSLDRWIKTIFGI